MLININNYILAINIIALFLVLMAYQLNAFLFGYGLVGAVLLVTLCLCFIFIFRSERHVFLKGNVLKHSVLILIGLVIVNFQYYFDYYFGYIDKNELLLYVSDEAGAKSLMIGLIGLISFFVGFLLKGDKVYKRPYNHKKAGLKFLKILNILMLVGLLYNINPMYVFGGYGIYEMGVDAVYFTLLFKVSFFALIIQKVLNASCLTHEVKSIRQYFKYIGYDTIFLVLIYLTIVILSGDRGDLISFSLLMLMGYISITGIKVGRIKGFLLIFLAAFIITLLGVARSFNALEGSTFVDNISRAMDSNNDKREVYSISPITSELASSVKALNVSVENVPSKYDYLYSRFQVQAILSVMPFSSSVSNYIFNDNSAKYSSSDSYVTWLIEGESANTGHGTSIIADFYLSFGVLGVVVGMVLFGWLVRFCELNIGLYRSKYIIYVIVSMVLFASSIYLSRSSLLTSLRLIVWIWVLISLNSWLSKKLSR